MNITYDNTFVRSPLKEKHRVEGNYITMPVTSVNGNTTYIPPSSSNPRKVTDLYKTTSVLLARNPSVTSGSTFPGIPCKYPGRDGGTGTTGNSVSMGMFCCKYSSSEASVFTTADIYRVEVIGIDTRWDDASGSVVYTPATNYRRYEAICPALSGSGTDVTISDIPANFYITGIWAENQPGSGVWWAPMLLLHPNDRNWPHAAGSLKVRCDCAGLSNEWMIAANTYKIVVVGFEAPQVLPTAITVPLPAMAATTSSQAAGIYATTSTTIPAGFITLGAYMIGNNGSNYYAAPWGIYSGSLTANSTANIIVANPLNTAGGLSRAKAATDLSIRIVGIQT